MIRRIYLELRRRVEAFVKYTGTFGLLLNPAASHTRGRFSLSDAF